MKNRNTATITWLKYHNFGTFLQAYALQQIILSLGYVNHIFDDSAITSSPGNTGCLYRLKSIARFLLALLNPVKWRFRGARQESKVLYARFADKYLTIDHISATKPEEADLRYDQYICGSDQIWCPILEEHLNPYYYAYFTHKKRIAYAASFGVDAYPDKLRQEFINLTDPFASISCREKIGCRFVQDILGKRAAHVLDPTLLLSDVEWRQVAASSIYAETGEHYMLTYFLTPNSWYVEFARRYASMHNLKLKTFFLRPSSIKEADEAISAGPAEFIWLIDNADVFFTDSFHGSIFATLMQTPFVGFQRFSNESGGQNHRLMDLYRLMKIEDRYIADASGCNHVEKLPPMDFSLMKKSLQPFIENSISELSHSLSI